MANKLLISISTHGATVASWRGNRIADCREFMNDPAGHAGFKDYVGQYSGVPAHILVDAVEEDYRLETLPHATGSDRSDMVARKLKQHYRNTPYIAAWLLGRDSDKRRDDRYLFSALTNPDLISDWLQAVAAHGLPVAGIYLLPMVTAALLGKIETKATNLLVVAQHAGGLRLTFFRDLQFRLSRLTRGDSGREENRGRYFAEEISNTRLYLHALRTISLEDSLTVLLIDCNDELGDVPSSLGRETPGLECIHLGRRDLARRLGITEALLDFSPYAIFLHLLGLKEPQSNLAPSGVTVGYKRYKASRTLYTACAALTAAAAIWTGANVFQMIMVRSETEDAVRRTAQLASQYAEITRQFPQAPTSAENLQKAVEIAHKLRENTHGPQHLMALVSRVVEASPTVIIKEFGWKFGDTEIESEPGARQGAADNPAAPSTGSPGQNRRESALIEGEIRPFRGDYRSAILAINNFARRLGEEPAVAAVRVVKLPLNVNPSLSLAGNTLDNPEQNVNATADFKLLILIKPNT